MLRARRMAASRPPRDQECENSLKRSDISGAANAPGEAGGPQEGPVIFLPQRSRFVTARAITLKALRYLVITLYYSAVRCDLA
jgi:hypothetical protein